jgi:lipid-A-disaccharide synthase
MVNLIAGEKVVPELVQHDFTAAQAVAELGKVLPDGSVRTAMLTGLERVKSRLRSTHPGDTGSAAQRAALIILQMLGLDAAPRAAGRQAAAASNRGANSR